MAKRITYHNGRSNKHGVYSAKHNDRNFDTQMAEHIEPSETDKNIYWHYYQKSSPEMSFEQCELKYYKEHFGNYIEVRNEKSVKQGHKERVQSIADYHKSRKSCPEETIFQVGNIANRVSSRQLKEIFAEYWAWKDKHYPQCVTLNIAYHADEQGSAHIHERHVWVAHDHEGREMVNQGEALKEMSVERPEPKKKEGRYNNAKMTYTKAARSKLAEICKSYGVEIETEPKEASKSGKDLLAWQMERDNIRRDEAKAELQKAVEEHKETLEAITRAEVYLAGINEETEKEKKRAEEIKALADAEAKRIAKLRDADAERQRQHEVELQNLKEKADKEEMRAKKNKALADEAEARLRHNQKEDVEWQKQANQRLDSMIAKAEEIKKEKEKVESEYNQLSADVSQLKMNRDFLKEKNEGLLEYQRQIIEDNQQYETGLHAKADALNRAESIISEAKSAEWQLNFLRTQIPSAQKELEEIKTKKEKSIEIISQVAEPVLNVSEAIQSKNKNKLWIAVQGLVKAFGAIAEHIPFFKVMWENRELIENQQFDEAYQNLCEAEPELTAEERGLKFLRSVARVHGTNTKIISDAIRTVADVEGKDTAFEVQLLNSIRNTDEYKNQQAINNLQNAKKQNGWRD